MADLYTSLVRLKQAMNGGQLPPMTPVPESVHHLIDPAFTIGQGALREDEGKGLQCPVRGCGVFRHSLSNHISKAHRSLGGASAIKRALDIPDSTPLWTKARSARYSAQMATQQAASGARLAALGGGHTATARKKAAHTQSRTARSVGVRNLRNRCAAQLQHAFADMENYLGRQPSARDARSLKSAAWVDDVSRVYGSWNNALSQLGLRVLKPSRVTLDDVVNGLRAWYDAHGTLPSERQARDRDRSPLIPSDVTIRRRLGEPTWYACMRRAAILLNIRDGRYGVKPIADYYAADAKEAKNPKEAHDVAADTGETRADAGDVILLSASA